MTQGCHDVWRFMCLHLRNVAMPPLLMIREPLVVTFHVPEGLAATETSRLIDAWYNAIGGYDFVYLGGTSFALNPPCPDASALEAHCTTHVGGAVTVEPLSAVLYAAAEAPLLAA